MKKTVAISIAVLLFFITVLSACSGSGSNQPADNQPNQEAKSSDNPKSEAPMEINIMSDFSIAQPPAEDNPVIKEFEKRTNTKLNITWISYTIYNDKLNVALASGDLPDLVKIMDFTNAQFQTMAKQGAFWDLTPFLKDYENLMNSPKVIWENTKIKGKNYVIPIVRPLEVGGLAIRKDWLDKLGLPVPQTTDDLYNVMKAFRENKPDGKKDTYGFTMRGHGIIEQIFTASHGRWKEADGKLIDVTLEPEMRESILYRKKLFDEGLIPPDFSVMKDNQFWDLATSGSAGVTNETIEALWRWTYDQWKRDPNVEWLPLVSLAGPNGQQFTGQGTGFIGVAAIPKKVPEEKVRKILSVLDFGASEEGGTMSLYGLEGIHHTKEDGFYVTTEQSVKDSVGVGSFGKLFMKFDPYMYAFAPGMPKEVFERNKKIIDEKSKISTPNATVGLISETDIRLGADYNKKINDLKTQIIMGKSKIGEWDRLIDELKRDPNYQKIIEEMNGAYQERLASK
ncbi:extracellular solute-binding protein [Paenibacillus alkalitolerans]|uniref:extracellular solute-binding protein n=1 Tax=Paenibacillus alkalitolerans TaxID=2799335 RepID=UPI0018F4C185|nr:extracellular solute-binding protein [Paenibacillus alkalitolerans]